MRALIAAAHGLPLLFIAAVWLAAPLPWMMFAVAAVLAGISLARELHRQRAAAGAVMLEAGGDNVWRLFRGDGESARVDLINCADFGAFMFLLAQQDGKKFRLFARTNAQQKDQLHRLRLWFKWRGKSGTH